MTTPLHLDSLLGEFTKSSESQMETNQSLTVVTSTHEYLRFNTSTESTPESECQFYEELDSAISKMPTTE